MIATVDGVVFGHCAVGGGEVPLLHKSIPCTVTTTVGEPVEVVNVHDALFGSPKLFMSPLMETVVLPDASVMPGPLTMPSGASQVPVSCTPGTGVPLPFSSVSFTMPPLPRM